MLGSFDMQRSVIPMGCNVADRLGLRAISGHISGCSAHLGQLAGRDPTSHNDEIGSERTATLESSQDSKVVIDQSQQYFSNQVISPAIRQTPEALASGLVYDVDHQGQKSVDKLLPCPVQARKTAVQ